MNKFIKLTAIEFYDKDSVYTEIFEDYTRFMRFQRITEPVYRRLENSLKASGVLVPDINACLGGTFIVTYNNNSSLYIKESPEELLEKIKTVNF